MLLLKIKVTPSASRTAFVLDKQGQLKAFISSAPEKGKANKELIKFLAKSLQCPQGKVALVAGATHRVKTIKLDLPLSYEEVLSILGLSHQTSLIG